MLTGISTIFVITFFVISAKANDVNDDNGILFENKVSVQLRFFGKNFDVVTDDDVAIPLLPIKLHYDDEEEERRKNFTFKLISQELNSKNQFPVFVSKILPDQSKFILQSDNGILFNGNESIIFWINTTNLCHTGFSIEIIDHTVSDERKFYGFISPFKSNETLGLRTVTLVDDDGEIQGEITVNYLVIRPVIGFEPTAPEYISFKNITFTGHRGTGSGVRTDLKKHLIENTISAFNYVCSKGAEMIELDVQLSAEGIPIIYHDFEIKTYVINRYDNQKNLTIRFPVKDTTYEEMQQISTNYMPSVSEDSSPEDQSFETLESVLKELQPGCGIDVEIKYPQQQPNGKYETVPGMELNEYVDRILKVLFEHGGERPMFITSFHPDLCSMIRLKQNKYHIGFLTSGYKWTTDPRSNSLELGVAFAQSMFFDGMAPDVSLILDPEIPGHYPKMDYIKQRNLGVYLWGSKINNYPLIRNLTENGADLVIFDHIDKIMPEN